MEKYTLHSLSERNTITTKFVEEAIQCITLEGDLGSGKTSCVQSRVSSLGYDGSIVTSPTYTYMNVYYGTILHIDMWRIESAEQLHELGLLDAIDTYEYIAIEWPKRKEQWDFFQNTRHIIISKNNNNTRTITIK